MRLVENWGESTSDRAGWEFAQTDKSTSSKSQIQRRRNNVRVSSVNLSFSRFYFVISLLKLLETSVVKNAKKPTYLPTNFLIPQIAFFVFSFSC